MGKGIENLEQGFLVDDVTNLMHVIKGENIG